MTAVGASAEGSGGFAAIRLQNIYVGKIELCISPLTLAAVRSAGGRPLVGRQPDKSHKSYKLNKSGLKKNIKKKLDPLNQTKMKKTFYYQLYPSIVSRENRPLGLDYEAPKTTEQVAIQSPTAVRFLSKAVAQIGL
jgi:hypothetical protein